MSPKLANLVLKLAKVYKKNIKRNLNRNTENKLKNNNHIAELIVSLLVRS